jgi:demethylmenaquinone methyltransferase/2-methoxy-6-polyprenyl-1,4-benzoquinol methylase/ArsR family transcriptional regulator
VLDLGTGTGRMLELLAAHANRAVGLDQSPAMLNVARARLDHAGFRNVQLRQGDIYALPVERDGYDLVVIHQVLHYLDDPARALREAARTLRPGGQLVIIDFAPHDLEFLRETHAHRRLGFSHAEVATLLEEAGLAVESKSDLTPQANESDRLTVSIWVARDRRIVTDLIPAREVA